MVQTPFDLKQLEENNPRPSTLGEDEPWNPISPKKEVLKAYADAKYPYEKTVHDRAADEFYALVKGRPEKITQEVTQVYRRKIATEGEFIFYNLTLRGEDWKGNIFDYAMLEGTYSMPLFRKEKDPQTDKVTTSQINDHRTVYNIPWSKEKFDELLNSTIDNLSMIIYGTAGRRLGISSVDDYRDGTMEDLIQCAMSGKSLESVLAEKNQFTYEKVAPKAAKHN
jgi:hypothetical protein